jgi:hypothetical protein
MAAPPIVDTVVSAAGVAGSEQVAKKVGAKFDKRFPPAEDESVDD